MTEGLKPILSKLKKLYSDLEKELYKSTIDHLVDNLSIRDGIIQNSELNIKVINNLGKSLHNNTNKIIKKIVDLVVDTIKNLIIDSSVEFEEISSEAVSLGTEIANLLAKQAVKTISSNITIEKAFVDIKKDVIGLMSKPSGISLGDIRKSLETKIIEKGITQKQFLNWTYNVFMQYNRAGNNEIRKKLKLKYAIYDGGLSDDSREFCEKLNGNVYSEDEILNLVNIDFKEKWEPYDPITDCGCYNCVHSWRWISNELAFELRPELKNKK